MGTDTFLPNGGLPATGTQRSGFPLFSSRLVTLLAAGLALLVLMFSLAGVPPMLGFFAKYAVLTAAVDAGLGWLAVLGVIASVIGAFYYLRIVYYMYFGAETEGVVSRMGAVQYLGLIVPALIMLVGAVNMFGVDAAAGRAAETLVSNEASPAPAEAAILPAEPERLE